MAGNDSSEEKKHPASDQKLKKQREKGNVAQSRESILAVSTIVGITYLIFMIGQLREYGLLIFNLKEFAPRKDFEHVFFAQFVIVGELMAYIVLPIMMLVIFFSVLASIMMTQGFVFSTERMKPDFNKLNPANGLKNIFGLQALKTALMHVLRLSFSGTILIFLIYYFVPTVFLSPYCELDCGISVNATVYFYVLLALLILSIIFAMIDFVVQRSEFLRQNKMTDTEQKQETKEQLGNPEIKGRIKEIQQEVVTKTVGMRNASFIVADGLKQAVAIRYVPGGEEMPTIVAKARGRNAVLRLASESGKPVEHSAELLALVKKIGVGDPIMDEAAIKHLVPFLHKYS